MKTWFFLLVVSTITALTGRAQQILCERNMSATAPTFGGFLFTTSGLLQPRPDSIRLVSDHRFGTNFANLFQTKLQRLSLATCDTLPTGPSSYRSTKPYSFTTVSCSNRHGQMLLGQDISPGPSAPDSFYIRLSLFGRDGRLRWQRRLPPPTRSEGITALIVAPGGGYFACGGQSDNRGGGSHLLLLRLDSLGRVQWRRTYFPMYTSASFSDLAYSRRGTLLIPVNYQPNSTTSRLDFGLLEVTQRGDSLTTHQIVIAPLQYTQLARGVSGSLQPLRDGGFVIAGEVDSASTGNFRPFLARLDANLNVTWFYVHRPRSNVLAYCFVHPYELADGDLTVLVSNSRSGRNEPFWLFRFAPTGALRNRYAFVPQVLPPLNQLDGFLGWLQGLQPLSDSTFVLASGLNRANLNGSSYSQIYMAHLRVPGLPRVIDSHYLPAALAARAGAALAPEALGPPHPNPAAETVLFTYTLPGGSAPAVLVLRDVAGRRVLAQALASRTGTAHLAVAGLPGGLYLATLEVGGQPYGGARKLAVLP